MSEIVHEIVLNIILVLFPILIYFVIICYKNLGKKKNLKLIFYITIFTSIYLIFNLSGLEDNCKLLLVLNIPIVVCYIKNEDKYGYLISLIIVFAIYNSYIELLYLLVKYTLFYIFNYLIKSKTKYLEIIAIFEAFCLSFENYLYFQNMTASIGARIYLTMIIFYLITILVLYLFKLADKIMDLYSFSLDLEKEKEMKNSLFKLTHEIKNPLAVCKGYLDMIDITDEENINKYVGIIKSEIERSLNIMNDFSIYSKLKIMKEDMDINILLDDVYDGFKILLKNNNINFIYNNSDDDKYIYGDYERLKQVLLNILKNSMEAIDYSGNITLESYIKKKYIIINVKDDGMGMDKETLEKIKTIFYTTKKNGNGIGVSLSNEIIKHHNGQLIYKSSKGKGTIVTIKLLI